MAPRLGRSIADRAGPLREARLLALGNVMLADTLYILGYRPEDDSWDTDGRRTYSHDDATRAYLTTLRGILGRQGFERDPNALRTFRRAGEIIEIEPGGADCSGHYLHFMKAETV